MATKPKHNKSKENTLIEQLGGAKQIRRELAAYSHRVARMEERRDQLTREHPDKWVAIADDKIVVVAGSLQEVLEELDRHGIRRADAVVEFMNTQPRNLIL